MNYSAINIQGNIISSEILEKIRSEDIRHQTQADFGLDRNTTIRDEIGIAWAAARAHWTAFSLRRERLKEKDTGTSETRQGWMIPFLRELGYDLEKSTADVINNKTYAISHRAVNRDTFPVHIVGINQSLDKRADIGGARLSPHALIQEYLNNHEHLYALVTNGRFLRLLRDATRLSRLSYLEFDLERIMEEDLFAEFALLYRLLHVTRMPEKHEDGEESTIEFYHQEALDSGSRIREKLSEAVEQSLKELANGLLKHPDNTELQEQALTGKLKPNQFYLYLLRLVYRVLFLMVVEERQLIYTEKRSEETIKKRNIYYKYYSINRLTKLAEKQIYVDPQKTDLWKSLLVTFKLFENSFFGDKLDIKPLGSGLFSPDALGNLGLQNINNGTLLKVLQLLVTFENENQQQVRVNYADLDVEEFGSVYEGLLEYDPAISKIDGRPTFSFVKGEGRSSSGSHYTPEELVKPLIKHSLEYIIEERLNNPSKYTTTKNVFFPSGEMSDVGGQRGQHALTGNALRTAQESALLSITVADVACGSGHILLSAARRIALELARVRTSEDQPTPPAIRQATRDVIRKCVYGVDLNPLAVELCKVALWLEAHNPGEPLNFLDHRIKCGNAIVGLGRLEELTIGIPNEAYKTLVGDDKVIAMELLGQNKKERLAQVKNKRQSEIALEMATENINRLHIKITEWGKLPETTPEEIETKASEYKKIVNSSIWWRLKVLADIQVSQFFIPKQEVKHFTTNGTYWQQLITKNAIQNQAAANSSSIANRKRFFHWFLEFPEIFIKGGFDCILGNPPFLGGAKIRGNYGSSFLNWILSKYTPIGAADIVAFFFRRIFSIIQEKGYFSLISTNSISQGKSREGALAYILKNGGNFNYAFKNMKWPGLAAVNVSLISCYKGEWKSLAILNGSEVNKIGSSLDDSQSSLTPFSLSQNHSKSFKGVEINGTGFLLDFNEARSLRQDTKNKEVVMPYLTGQDLNSSPAQGASRYAINFKDFSLNKDYDLSRSKPKGPPFAEDYPDCIEIVRQKVKPEREKNSEKSRKERWWLHGRNRPELLHAIEDIESVVAIARISKTVAFEMLPKNQVFADALVIIASDRFDVLAILQSNLHIDWAWKYCTTLKSDLNYTASETFETFPFPKNRLYSSEKLQLVGKRYQALRKDLMHKLYLGLTKSYNLYHSKEIKLGLSRYELMNKNIKEITKQYGKETWNLWNHLQKTEGTCTWEEAVEGIEELRRLHVEMDNAVLDAYGWHKDSEKWGKAINLNHNFYVVDYLPENDRIRFTISPEARKEVLKRLLLLNHERYEEEIKQGLHKKKDVVKFYEQKGIEMPLDVLFSDVKPKKKPVKKITKPTQTVQPSLFDTTNTNIMKEFGLHDGIYSIRDTADIINQPYNKVRRWFLKLSEANYEGLSDSAKTDIENRRICFHGLVELVVIGELLEANVKPKSIFIARKDLASISKQPYPFATSDVKDKLKVSGSDIVFDFDEGLVTLDGSRQFNLDFIREFFADIVFESRVAIQLLPAKGNKRIQINPKAAGGRPAFVSKKNVTVETIVRFYNGPDSMDEIIEDYGITKEDVEAALAYQS